VCVCVTQDYCSYVEVNNIVQEWSVCHFCDIVVCWSSSQLRAALFLVFISYDYCLIAVSCIHYWHVFVDACCVFAQVVYQLT